MSKIQGIVSANSGQVVVDEGTGNVVSTHDVHQIHAAIQVNVGERTTEDHNHDTYSNESSSETVRNVLDKGNILNMKINETDDETMNLKEHEMIEERNSGECRNILPILIEHLRAALQLSTINKKPTTMDEAHISGGSITIPSSGHSDSQRTREQTNKSSQSLLNKTDHNFLQDLILADIKTALVRLQDLLCRVDVEALCRCSSSLEPYDKLQLLQMISSLVTDLKSVKLEDASHSVLSTNKIRKNHSRGRNRHTIGVSSEELARAREWLKERGPSSLNVPIITSSISSTVLESHSAITQENTGERTFDKSQACHKHMKDAINQQQSLQNRHRDLEASSMVNTISDCKTTTNNHVGDRFNEWIDASITTEAKSTAALMVKSCNKFIAKKSKIKRANTIDIPSYLQLQTEFNKQSSSTGLRRPIDISDRSPWNPPQINNMTIPSFEPKTENDRKFLALINRNSEINDINASSTQSPFKSFNYRQTSSVADKNWKSRFSNIKTTFDKVTAPTTPPPSSQPSQKKSPSINASSSIIAPSNQIQWVSRNNFSSRKPTTYPQTSIPAFQNMETRQKDAIRQETPLSPTSFLPACASSGMLQAKVKMFDYREGVHDSPPRVKNECPQMNFLRHNKKVIQSASDLMHPQLTEMRRSTGSFHQLSKDNYSRRNTISHNEIAQLDAVGRSIQRRQSVAVQTMDKVFGIDKLTRKIDQNDTFAMLRRADTHSRQQIQSLSSATSSPSSSSTASSSLATPITSVPLTSIISKPFHSGDNKSPCLLPHGTHPTYKDVTMIKNACHSIADSRIKEYCNFNPNLSRDGNHNSANNDDIEDNDVENHKNHNSDNGNNAEDNDNATIEDTSPTADNSFMNDQNIENQDISDDGIVTRYTSAIVTVEKSSSPPRTFSPNHVSDGSSEKSVFCMSPSFPLSHNIRHNVLQQNITHHLQPQPGEHQWSNCIMEPSHNNSTLKFGQTYNFPSINPLLTAAPPTENDYGCGVTLIESNNTREKINLFEGILSGENDCPTDQKVPLIHSRIWPVLPDRVPSTINIANYRCTKSPSRFQDCPSPATPSSAAFKYQIGPGDTSDEYLVSCANRPHRSIVLSKSESWHQLAMSRSNVQMPDQIQNHLQQKSRQMTLSRSSKHADNTSFNKLKKMEEKVLKYFDSTCNISTTLNLKTEEPISKHNSEFLPCRKNQKALARSHTMPHIYDELTDIDKQFDSLFEQTIHDNRN